LSEPSHLVCVLFIQRHDAAAFGLLTLLPSPRQARSALRAHLSGQLAERGGLEGPKRAGEGAKEPPSHIT